MEFWWLNLNESRPWFRLCTTPSRIRLDEAEVRPEAMGRKESVGFGGKQPWRRGKEITGLWSWFLEACRL